MKRFSAMYRSLSELLSNQFSQKNDLVIVDVGCGPGLLLKELSHDFQGSTIMGIDVSLEMLQCALKDRNGYKNSQIVLAQASSEALPLKNHSVDAIVSRYSLPYWPQPSVAFAEFNRSLKPGGVLLLEALNADFPRWKLTFIKYKMIFRRASDEVITYHIDAYKSAYSLSEIRSFLSKAHFAVQEVIGSPSEWKFIIIATKKNVT